MVFDVVCYVYCYYVSLVFVLGNEYLCLRVWEYFWEYVWDFSCSWDDLIVFEQFDIIVLYLGFYLVNWGMFCGFLGLLQNSNLDLMKVLVWQFFSGVGLEFFELFLVDFVGNGVCLVYNCKLLEMVFGLMDVFSSWVSWIDILKSKILFGVWGEFFVFDCYYVVVCCVLYLCWGLMSVNGGIFIVLYCLIGEERLLFLCLEIVCKGFFYFIGCLVDMVFFQYGLENV